MPCGSTGRAEHGTTRADPSHAPGTQVIGWDYYLNLTKCDIKKILPSNEFGQHIFVYNKMSRDLYFLGCKKNHASVSQFNLDMFFEAIKPIFKRQF